MKKKILFMTLAAAVVLSACSSQVKGEKDSTPASQETTEAEDPTAEPAESESEQEEEKEEPAAEPDENEQASEPEVEDAENGEANGEEAQETVLEDEFIKGVISDTGWESGYLGMRYTLPEGMYMATEEELNRTMGLGAEVLSEDFSEQQLKYAQMRTVYEMMSLDATGATNVVMTVEKLPFSNMDAKAYVQALENQLAQVTAIPYTIVSDDETVNIAGKDYIKVGTQIDPGDEIVKQDYYVRVADGRAVCLVMTYSDETAELADTVLNAFTAYSDEI